MRQLQGKIALVTGGGRGIGRGVVDRFLEEGASVAVVQRKPLNDALNSHPRVAHVEADLSVLPSVGTAVEHVVERFGGVDVLVNNAGIMTERPVAEILPEEWELTIAVNLRAPLFLAQAVLPHMRRRGGGSIINIGSIEGLGANPGHAAYCASKAGLHGMTRAMAVDLGADNIRCNAIAPGLDHLGAERDVPAVPSGSGGRPLGLEPDAPARARRSAHRRGRSGRLPGG